MTTHFEMPDAEYPIVLNTGWTAKHWQPGIMTMRVPRFKASNPAGIAIIVETETMNDMTSITKRIKQRADVAGVQMTYCNWEVQAR